MSKKYTPAPRAAVPMVQKGRERHVWIAVVLGVRMATPKQTYRHC